MPPPAVTGRRRAATRPAGRASALEFVALSVVVLVALALRGYDIVDLPSGFHGDEGVAGLEGQRILDEGYLGPYSTFAAGQPSGPLYLVGLSVAAFGHTIFAVRFVALVAGVLAIPALYVATRPFLGREVALVAAAALAVMPWHVHFARIGFPLEWWPLVVLAGAGLLARAVQTGSRGLWIAAGAVAGTGIYVYNAQPIVLFAMGIYLLGVLASLRSRELRETAFNVACFSLTAVAVSIPMIEYAYERSDDYFAHTRRDSLTATAQWDDAPGPADRVSLVMERYVDVWQFLVHPERVDSVDAAGVLPMVPPLLAGLSAIGLVLALWKHRNELVYLGAVLTVTVPLGAALTVDGTARRSFAVAPFLALWAAVAIVEGAQLAAPQIRRGFRASEGLVATLLATVVLGWTGITFARDYFGPFRDSADQRWVFVADYTDAVRMLADAGGRDYAYLLSDRHSFNYETRQFLLPSGRGEDRSTQFSAVPGLMVTRGVAGSQVFVLIGPYRSLLPDLVAMYPRGQVIGDPADPDAPFLAYRIDVQ